MPKLANPNHGVPFERVQGDFGYRTVDGIEEIVNTQTGESNMSYFKPEVVLDPTGCTHNFVITDIGKREVECDNCHWAFAFHAGRNYFEDKDGAVVIIKGRKYQIGY